MSLESLYSVCCKCEEEVFDPEMVFCDVCRFGYCKNCVRKIDEGEIQLICKICEGIN